MYVPSKYHRLDLDMFSHWDDNGSVRWTLYTLKTLGKILLVKLKLVNI